MLIGGISPYSKVVALRVVNSSEILWCFKLEFFSNIFVRYFTIKVSNNWWNLFYNAKSSKYHSTEKQPLPWILSLYNLWGWFLPPFWSHRVISHNFWFHVNSKLVKSIYIYICCVYLLSTQIQIFVNQQEHQFHYRYHHHFHHHHYCLHFPSFCVVFSKHIWCDKRA